MVRGQNNIHPSIHPIQSALDLTLPDHLFQLFREHAEAFPGQLESYNLSRVSFGASFRTFIKPLPKEAF